jgi:hypothetical protein
MHARLHPRRQYVFRKRGDRQRIAVRLAAGMGVEAVAAVERADAREIAALLTGSVANRQGERVHRSKVSVG